MSAASRSCASAPCLQGAVRAFIALGANLADPARQVRAAIAALRALPACQLGAVSPLYQTTPMGPQDQPDYINAVVELHTTLAPLPLLDVLQVLELAHGRERHTRWGARTLDLDLLLYGQAEIHQPRLTVPHYGLSQRDFVLVPLCAIAPDVQVPGLGRARDLLARLGPHQLTPLAAN
ncbi:MAG: 2-amino-4-hydroxy-6-hydroxymethyldihydropteridine diphosphokinase [Aeromonas sp.]